MELDAKNPQLALAECRKITCVHAESGMKEYNEQNTTGSAAAEATVAKAARKRFVDVFDESALLGRGVRWRAEWEQLNQLRRI
jgi:hypothetical protein